MKRRFFAGSIAVFLALPLFAQSKEWKLDRAHSSVTFTIKHMVISEVTGRFDDFNITLASSKPDFTDATLDGSIKVESIDTGNPNRDKHLKTDDFFNAEKYPEMKFRSSSIEKVDDKDYRISGDLTIRDVTKKVVWDAVLSGTLATSHGTRAAWKATLAINRFDYGLKWDRVTEAGGLVAGETVTITILGEFVSSSGT
ncbi:MAG TPA: YceI family protein [Bacteroidota bacterium]|nr:YceI family protein [Bacteroidota bacterium]